MRPVRKYHIRKATPKPIRSVEPKRAIHGCEKSQLWSHPKMPIIVITTAKMTSTVGVSVMRKIHRMSAMGTLLHTVSRIRFLFAAMATPFMPFFALEPPYSLPVKIATHTNKHHMYLFFLLKGALPFLQCQYKERYWCVSTKNSAMHIYHIAWKFTCLTHTPLFPILTSSKARFTEDIGRILCVL